MDAHPNFAFSTVATAPSPATSGTSLVVASGGGALFAAFPFNATVSPANATRSQMATTSEIIRITGRSGDTLTIVRAQEGTSARTIIVGDEIAVTGTSKALTDIETDLASADSQIALQAAQIETRRIADLGYFVYSGLLLAANASQLTSVSRSTGNNTFDKTAHGLIANDTITFSGLANTTGVTNGTVYFISATGLTANAFRVAATSGGTALTLGGTTDSTITTTQVGKLDMPVGVQFAGTTELNVTAQTAISTTIASMSDATNPKWVSVELNGSNVVVFNQGTAAATPVMPTIATTNTPLGLLYVPSNTTQVDALLTTSNGLAKLFDTRIVRSVHTARRLGEDHANTSLSNPGSLTTLLAATVLLPANSLNVGDLIEVNASGRFVPGSATDTTLQFQILFGSLAVFDVTTGTLTKAANGTDARQWTIRMIIDITSVGGGNVEAFFAVGAVQSAITADRTAGANAAAQGDLATLGGTKTFDSNVANVAIDLQATRGTSAAGSTIVLRHFSVRKYPV